MSLSVANDLLLPMGMKAFTTWKKNKSGYVTYSIHKLVGDGDRTQEYKGPKVATVSGLHKLFAWISKNGGGGPV